MDAGKKILPVMISLGIALLQLISTQVVTLLVSFVLPDIESFPITHPKLFALILGISFTTGVFLTGWLAIKLRWLKIKPMYPTRLVATLISAYIPLLIAIALYPSLEPGNPFFFISEIASIVGFYSPGWISKR